MELPTDSISWNEFYKLKEGTVLKTRWIRYGNSIMIQIKQNRQWRNMVGFCQAAPGEGIMNWEDFKERTQGM